MQTVAVIALVDRQVGGQFQQSSRARRQLQHVGRVTLRRRREQQSYLVCTRVLEEFHLQYTKVTDPCKPISQSKFLRGSQEFVSGGGRGALLVRG